MASCSFVVYVRFSTGSDGDGGDEEEQEEEYQAGPLPCDEPTAEGMDSGTNALRLVYNDHSACVQAIRQAAQRHQQQLL